MMGVAAISSDAFIVLSSTSRQLVYTILWIDDIHLAALTLPMDRVYLTEHPYFGQDEQLSLCNILHLEQWQVLSIVFHC